MSLSRQETLLEDEQNNGHLTDNQESKHQKKRPANPNNGQMGNGTSKGARVHSQSKGSSEKMDNMPDIQQDDPNFENIISLKAKNADKELKNVKSTKSLDANIILNQQQGQSVPTEKQLSRNESKARLPSEDHNDVMTKKEHQKLKYE